MADQVDKLPKKLTNPSSRFAKNKQQMAEMVSRLRAEEEQIRQGGGSKAIEAQHAKSRLTARERIELLLDRGSPLFELGLYAGYEMYEEWGGAPAAGVITGLGRM